MKVDPQFSYIPDTKPIYWNLKVHQVETQVATDGRQHQKRRMRNFDN